MECNDPCRHGNNWKLRDLKPGIIQNLDFLKRLKISREFKGVNSYISVLQEDIKISIF
jgi:hypothetical protein